MKKLSYILKLIFISVFIGFSTIGIHAQDIQNINITIETDKREYKIGDDIYYKVTVQNKSGRSGDNVVVRLDLPEEVQITDANGRISSKYVLWEHLDLDIDETITLHAKGNVKKKYVIPNSEAEPPADMSSKISEKEKHDNIYSNYKQKYNLKGENSSINRNHIETADYNDVQDYFLLFFISGVVVILVLKYDKKKKAIKVLMIFSLSGTALCSSCEISAAEEGIIQYQALSKIENIINGKHVLTEVKASMDVTLNNNAVIDLKNDKDENNSITTYEESITILGTARDPDGINKIEYKVYKDGLIYDSGTAKGINEWSFSINPKIGDSEIRIYCIDKKGNNTHISTSLHRYNKEIILNDNVTIPNEKEIANLADSIVDVYENEDGIYIIFDKSMLNTDLKSLLQKNSILCIEPCVAFSTGMTLKVNDVLVPSKVHFDKDYLYPNGIKEYSDSSYIVALMQTPTYPDLFKSDVSINLSDAKVDTNNPIAFAVGGDGKPLKYKKQNSIKYMLVSKSTERKLDITALMPEIEIDENRFLLKADNRVFYDADGDKKTENDQIIYSGKFGIDNLKLTGGVDWTLSDFDLFPKQLKTDIDYDFVKEMGFTYKGEMDLKDLVEEANKELNGGYENKQDFLGINIQGIDLNTQIYLGSVGVRIAPAFTTVNGNLQDISNQSLIPVVVFSFVMNVEGNIYAKASITYDDSSHTKMGLNVQKDGYTGQMGTQAENRGQIHSDALGYSIDLYSKNGKSADHMDIEPDAELRLKAEGYATTRVGLGGNADLMMFGIMPASLGLSIDAEGEAQGNLDAIFYDKKDPVFKIDGSYSIEVLMNFNYAIKIMCQLGENGKPFGINEKGSNPIWSIVKMTSDNYKPKDGQGSISGTIIDKNSKKPINNLYLELADSEGKIIKHVSTNDKGEFSLTYDAGTYHLDITKAGYLNPHQEVTIEKNKTIVLDKDIELEKMESGFYGSIIDENKIGLDNVTVIIIDEHGDEIKKTHSTPDGLFNDSLPVGTYKLKFQKEGYGYQVTDIILSGNVVKVPDIHMKRTIFAAGDGSNENPYEIVNEAQFNGIRDYPEASYILLNDLDFSSFGKWTPIGNEAIPFSGNLDGKGHKIANLKLTNGDRLNGIFGTVIVQNSQEIKDTTFENITNNGTANEEREVGIVVAHMEVRNNGSMNFSNINIIGSTLQNKGAEWTNDFGGFIANCTLSGNGKLLFDNCVFDGSIYALVGFWSKHVYSGGFIGNMIMNNNSSLTFNNCTEKGTIRSLHSTSAYTGGFIGNCLGDNDNTASLIMYNCRSDGYIHSETWYGYCSAGSGGIIGGLSNIYNTNFEKVSHNNNLFSEARTTGTGGIFGSVAFNNGNNTLNLKNCYHVGQLETVGVNGDTLAGGCIGRLEGGGKGIINIENCYFSGSMDAVLRGGILGAFLNSSISANIKNSYFDYELMGLKDTDICGSSTFYNPNKDLIHITDSYGLKTFDLRNRDSYHNWDFENVWGISSDGGLPYLI